MSLIKQHLHKLENPDYYPIDIDDRYQVELSLSLNDVELILSYLEETDDARDNALADEIRTQTYA